VSIVLVALGAVGLIGYLIWLIFCIINWDSKIPSIIGVLMSFVMIVGGVATMQTSDSPKTVGEDDRGQQVSSQDKADTPEDPPKKEADGKGAFGIGESVNSDDIVVTLVDVSENEGTQFMKPSDGNVFLLCEFEIENNSKKDITVSSLVSFEAYVDDYSTIINISALSNTDKKQLDGSVASGKKMNGVIGYEVPADWSELEINFTPDFWSKSIQFVVKK